MVQSYSENITITGGGAATHVAISGNGVSTSTPTLSVTPSSLSFGSVEVNSSSGEQTYTLSGSNLTPTGGTINVTAPSGFQISQTSGSGFGSSLTITYTGGALSARTIYVRFAPTAVQGYSGNVTNIGGGATINVTVSGSGVSSTALSGTPSSLSFGNVEVNTTSGEQTYTLSGSNLTPTSDSITITAPTGFQVSKSTETGFTSSVRVGYTGGALSARTIYVRFTPTAVQGYSGNVMNIGGGDTAVVVVSGNGVSIPVPTLSVTPSSLSFGSVEVNTISSERTYTLSGSNLTPASDSVTITVPTGFQVSRSTGTGFASSVKVGYTSGAFSARTIYVRCTPTAVQSYSGNVTNIGGGDTAVVVVNGSGVSTPVPTLSVIPSSFSFGSIVVNSTSAEQTYTLSGSNLTPASGNINVTTPSGFQISQTSGSGFGSSLTIAYTSGALSAKTIYIRFTPTAVQSYNGNVTNIGGGDTAVIVVSGSGASAPTPTLSVTRSSLSFDSVVVNTTSGEQTYILSGSNLTPTSGNITVTAPSRFQISQTSGSGFGSSLTIAYTSGTLSAKTIYVRFTPTSVRSYSGNVTNIGGGATKNVAVSGVSIPAPTLTVTPSSLSLGNVTVNTTSSEWTYRLSGSNLTPTTDSITITAPTGFQVSRSTGTGFAPSIKVGYTAKRLSARTLYVRFTPTAVRSYSGNVTNIGGGATKNVLVSGNGIASTTPTLTVTPNSLTFNSVDVNTISGEQTYTLIGSNLTPASDSITITAPTGFQVSISTGTGFGSSVKVGYTSGALTTRTIYARFAPTAEQSYSGNITNNGGGATTKNVAVSGSGVSITAPLLGVTPSSLTFNSVEVNTISGEQTYTLVGSNLTPASDSITITAPTGFQVSRSTGSGFTSSVKVDYTGDTFSAKTIYVRFEPIAVQGYNGNMMNVGGGDTAIVVVSGSGVSTPVPTLNITPTSLSFENVLVNTTSGEQTYILSGSNLTPASDSITITVPTGFQVSKSTGIGFNSSVRVGYTSGVLSARIIYVRFTPTLAQVYSGNVMNIGGGATAIVAISGIPILPPLPVGTLTATPQTLPFGGGLVTLVWTSQNSDSASIDQGIGWVNLNDSITVSVTSTKTFTLTLYSSTIID